MEAKVVLPKTTYFKGGQRGVILMHAYTGSPNDVRQLGRYLNKAGYSVLLPMFSGHGTERPEDILQAGPKLWQENLRQSIEFMQKEGHQELAIFGLSLGGIFAMSAMEDYPEVIIGGGPLCSPIIAESKTNIIPSFLWYAKTAMKKASVAEAEITSRLPMIEKAVQSQIAEIKIFTSEVFYKMAEVEQPSLLVQAGKDLMIDPQSVYLTEAQLKKSPVEVKWYPESGHVITVGPEKLQLQEDILTFMNKLNWQAPLEN